MAKRLELDDSEWPIVRVNFGVGLEGSETSRLLMFYSRLLSRGERFAMVLDLRGSSPPKRPEQQRMSEHMQENRDAYQKQCAGAAYIGPSVLARMGLRTLLRVMRLPFENVVVSTPEEGEAWAREALVREAGGSA